jgi:hypothetical protein
MALGFLWGIVVLVVGLPQVLFALRRGVIRMGVFGEPIIIDRVERPGAFWKCIALQGSILAVALVFVLYGIIFL